VSRFSITIGSDTYSSKTAALKFYKKILNKYDFESKLNREDAKYIIALAFKECGTPEEITEFSEDVVSGFNEVFEGEEDRILSVIVDRHLEFRTTKCFYFIGLTDGKKTRDIFSYRIAINGLPSDLQKFSRACRFAVKKRIRQYKIQKFKNRPVCCVISGNVVEWEECQIDHKAPLTFSVIVKSFMVANNLDISNIEYNYSNSMEIFVDGSLAEKFDDFHKKMAVLRIVSSNENLKLSGSARIKPSKNDDVLV